MRFREFINENQSMDVYDSEKACEFISKNCKPFLAATKEPLYRGVRSRSPAIISQQPSDRAAKDSNSGFNFYFNLGTRSVFEVVNIRRKSLYCSGSRSQTNDFGKPYYVFPQGEFKCLWSKHIYDSYENSDLLVNGIIDNIAEQIGGYKFSTSVIDSIFEQLSTVTDPEEFIRMDYGKADDLLLRGYEENVSYNSGSYKTDRVVLTKKYNDPISEIFKSAIHKTIAEYYRLDTDMGSAIASRNEIGIVESHGLVMFSISAAEELVYELRMDNPEFAHWPKNADNTYAMLLQYIRQFS